MSIGANHSQTNQGPTAPVARTLRLCHAPRMPPDTHAMLSPGPAYGIIFSSAGHGTSTERRTKRRVGLPSGPSQAWVRPSDRALPPRSQPPPRTLESMIVPSFSWILDAHIPGLIPSPALSNPTQVGPSLGRPHSQQLFFDLSSSTWPLTQQASIGRSLEIWTCSKCTPPSPRRAVHPPMARASPHRCHQRTNTPS